MKLNCRKGVMFCFRSRIGAAFCSLILILVVVLRVYQLVVTNQEELGPSYDGTPLLVWISRSRPSILQPQGSLYARGVVQEIGTNGIPFFLKWMRIPEEKRVWVCVNHAIYSKHMGESISTLGWEGFFILGGQALPTLLALHDDAPGSPVTKALHSVIADDFGAVVTCWMSGSEGTRRKIDDLLVSRKSGAYFIWLARGALRPYLSDLLRLLASSNETNRLLAIELAGLLGRRARAAIPQLEQISREDGGEAKRSATVAISRIHEDAGSSSPYELTRVPSSEPVILRRLK